MRKRPVLPPLIPACRAKPTRWLRHQILLHQGKRCAGCDTDLEQVEYDHVIPLGLGGSNAPDNWAALCPGCHRSKTRKDLRQIAKAKRQRRFHETGRSRAPRSCSAWPGLGKSDQFDKSRKRCLDGTVVARCQCAECSPSLGEEPFRNRDCST